MVSTLRQALDLLGGVVLGKDMQLRLPWPVFWPVGTSSSRTFPASARRPWPRPWPWSWALSSSGCSSPTTCSGGRAGVSVFDAAASSFVFHPGPVFTNVLLADEINRGTPRTQSAC
jgi:MoxR-like ATPases